jgi:ABC-type branched-subunit amino acid transport system ATPase component
MMSEAFKQLMAEHRRLTILRALASPKSGGESNDSILQSVAVDAGIASSRDQIRSALTWLEEQDLVTLRPLESGTLVASISQRGIDVARGLVTVPGVRRPSPGC